MKTQFMKFILAASFALALAFTFSCSDDGGGGDNPFAGNPEYEWMKEEVKYYDPDDDEVRCKNGIVEYKCGVWYNPLTHVCIRKCDENDHDCVPELGTLELCGSQLSISYSGGRCQNGVIERKCGYGENAPWYNTETHGCSGGDGHCDVDGNCTPSSYEVTAKTRCGNEYYSARESSRCQNEVIERRCGHEETESWYNPKTHYCSYSYSNGTSIYTVKAIVSCGIGEVKYDEDRCNNGVLEYICDGSPGSEDATWYNPITQSCDRDNGYTIKNKTRCGS